MGSSKTCFLSILYDPEGMDPLKLPPDPPERFLDSIKHAFNNGNKKNQENLAGSYTLMHHTKNVPRYNIRNDLLI